MKYQGRVQMVPGTTEIVRCPGCKVQPVVHNGNYFCNGWGDSCQWALSHPAKNKSDKAICDLLGLDYS
jgi:hypothetical protein